LCWESDEVEVGRTLKRAEEDVSADGYDILLMRFHLLVRKKKR
jgi:hypothetical protein